MMFADKYKRVRLPNAEVQQLQFRDWFATGELGSQSSVRPIANVRTTYTNSAPIAWRKRLAGEPPLSIIDGLASQDGAI